MITSKKNAQLQFIQNLQSQRKTRDDAGLFLIEGIRLVEDALQNHAEFSEIYFASNLSDRGLRLIAQFRELSIPIEEVKESIFRSVMDTTNSQGIAAICRQPNKPLPEDMNFLIIADQLRDPGNLGTLLRTAAAAGAHGVITTPGSVDLYSPKVVRSAMGAHFHIHCREMTWDQITNSINTKAENYFTIYSASAEAQKPFWDCNFTAPAILIIGNEAEGISDSALNITNVTVGIPMPGKFESLNAAVAAGIIIFEIVRQRSK